MFARPQRRIVVAAVAFLGALVLTCVAALVNRLALIGTTGFLFQAVVLATTVPLVLAGFNALCDRCQPDVTQAAEATKALVSRELEANELIAEGTRVNGKHYSGVVAESRDQRVAQQQARLTFPIELRGRFRAARGHSVKRWVGQ